MMPKELEAATTASNKHETHSHLVSFLYELIIVRQDEELSEGTYLLSDKYLAEKSEDLAKRLLRP